jgi:hypothetical protein
MTKIKDIPSWLFGCDDSLKKYAPKTPPIPEVEHHKETEVVKHKIPKKPVKKQIVYSSEESEEEVVKKKKISKKAKAVSTDEDSFSESCSEEDFSEKKKKLKNLKKYLK